MIRNILCVVYYLWRKIKINSLEENLKSLKRLSHCNSVIILGLFWIIFKLSNRILSRYFECRTYHGHHYEETFFVQCRRIGYWMWNVFRKQPFIYLVILCKHLKWLISCAHPVVWHSIKYAWNKYNHFNRLTFIFLYLKNISW